MESVPDAVSFAPARPSAPLDGTFAQFCTIAAVVDRGKAIRDSETESNEGGGTVCEEVFASRRDRTEHVGAFLRVHVIRNCEEGVGTESFEVSIERSGSSTAAAAPLVGEQWESALLRLL